MTKREKVLATTLLAVMVVFGGGMLFHLFVYEPWSQVRAELGIAREQLLKKKNDLAQEERQIENILRINPRLSQWQKISLPPRDPQAKNQPGVSAEELKRKHLARLQVEYERYLSELLRSNGFRSDTIVITPRQPDRRSAVPAIRGKEPAYERMAFGVTGRGSLDSTVRMLKKFHETDLLHQVRSLSVALVSERPNSGFMRRGGGGGSDTLDVTMTVEALLVNGAEERMGLMPEPLSYKPQVLAMAPKRDYTRMDKRNIFTGIAPPPPERETERVVTEDRVEVLRFVKLTALWCDEELRRWEATLYDQAKGGPEKKLNMRTRDEFTIYDKDENAILEGRVVYIDDKQLIFKSDGKFYRMYCGDFMYPAVRTPVPTKELEELGVSLGE